MHRTFLALALAASFLTASPSGLLDPLSGFLSRSALSALWTESSIEEGCGADPDGRCLPAPEPTSDAGCGWDPDGLCLPGS